MRRLELAPDLTHARALLSISHHPGRKEGVPFVPPPEGGRLHVSQVRENRRRRKEMKERERKRAELRRCRPTRARGLKTEKISMAPAHEGKKHSLTSVPSRFQATLVGGDASTDVAVFYRPGGLPDEEEGGGKGRPPPQPLARTRRRGGGKSEAAALDLIFDHYAEFTAVAGGKDGAGAPAEVHLTGYELPDADGECVKRDERERGVG